MRAIWTPFWTPRIRSSCIHDDRTDPLPRPRCRQFTSQLPRRTASGRLVMSWPRYSTRSSNEQGSGTSAGASSWAPRQRSRRRGHAELPNSTLSSAVSSARLTSSIRLAAPRPSRICAERGSQSHPPAAATLTRLRRSSQGRSPAGPAKPSQRERPNHPNSCPPADNHSPCSAVRPRSFRSCQVEGIAPVRR